MASGHVNRANRPNTWLLRPMLQSEDSPCQPGAVHTWPIATYRVAVAILVAFGFEADISSLAEFDDSVENDPKATFGQTASEATRAPFLSRMVESATL
jgi:hypothetical protein